jgi:hypothetical protein
MSIGNEIAYRRSKRGKDATGSLVFDAERKRAQPAAEKTGKAAKKKTIEKFPG